METILIVFHLMLSVGLIGLILIQHGKGADMGAAFGSGASSTVFGAQGSGSFLSRSTGVLAALFFLTSMALAYFATQATERPGLMVIDAPAPIAAPAPVAEVPLVPTDVVVPATVETAVPTQAPDVGVPVVSEEPASTTEAPQAPAQEGQPSKQ